MKRLLLFSVLLLVGCGETPIAETASYKSAYATWQIEEASLVQRRNEEFDAMQQYYASVDAAGIREVAPNWTHDISEHQLRKVPLNPDASAAVSELVERTEEAREAWRKAFTARVIQEEIRDRARDRLDRIEAE